MEKYLDEIMAIEDLFKLTNAKMEAFEEKHKNLYLLVDISGTRKYDKVKGGKIQLRITAIGND